MSCGAFGGSGSCGGGGGGSIGMPGGMTAPRRYADRGFFDPFCMPLENSRCEPSCYFNPFVHAQCLGVDMNMEGFRKDILKCQEDYKKAVWAVLKKYAVGEGNKSNSNSKNSLSNHINSMMAGFDAMNRNGNNLSGFNPNSNNINNMNNMNNMDSMNNMNMMNMMDVLNPDVSGIFGGNPANARRSKSSGGFQLGDPRFTGVFRNQLPPM